MKNLSKFIGIIALAVVIMFSMIACKDDEDDEDNGWRKWIHPESAVTLDYSVDKDGVCTITVGGTADAYRWRAHVRRSIPAQAVNKTYLYKIEAWTGAGERTLTVQYYENNDTEIYLGKGMTIDSTKKTYDILGQEIPGDEPVPGLRFQCADQLGTFYVKVLSITEYTPSLDYELINDVDSPNNGTYRITSGAGMRGALYIPAAYNGKSVTEIGRDAFKGTSITSVTIPNSVTSIGNDAFANTGLTSVTIPASVTEIGGWAFENCDKLTSVIFATGSQLESIGWGAFINTAITSITIPASVTHISEAVFARCWNLTSITIDSSNPYYSSENGILYNKDKTELRSWPTASGNITIPSSVTDIGNDAFRDCKNLTGVTIPQIVTYIGSAAFCDCTNIASITIPATVTYINGGAFAFWTASQTINIQGHANHQSTINDGWNDNWYDGCNAVINYSGQ